ncbi:MAG: 4Fe-4S binding protein [Desulfovibrio sp.]
MKAFIYPSLATLSIWITAAHFLRQGDFWLFLTLFAFSISIWFRHAWTRPVLFAALLGAVLLWTKVSILLVSMRIATGGDWVRLGIILGAVIGVCSISALLTFLFSGTASGKEWFIHSPKKASLQASVFLLSAGALLLTKAKTPFAVVLADRFIPGSGIFEIFILALYGVYVAGKMYSPAGARKTRPLIWGLFSAVFFSQLFLGLSGIDQMLMTGKLHLPIPALIIGGPLYRGEGFFMPILFLTTVLLVGPAWCSHLCYIGAWDDKMSRLASARKPLSQSVMWKMRLGLLILVIFCALGLRALSLPISFALTGAIFFGCVGLMVMFFISRKMGVMTHCTGFCPMGIVANILGKLSPWRLSIRKDIEEQKLNAAQKVCRYSALTENAIAIGKPAHSCTLCLDCLSACRKGDIELTLAGKHSQHTRIIYITLVVSLHVLFLGVARM